MPDRSPDRSTYLPLKHKNSNGINHKNGNGSYTYSLPTVAKAPETDGDSIDLRQLTRMVKHRLRLICAVVAGVTATTAIITFNQEPIYKGSFKLLVEPVSEEQEDSLALLQQGSGGLDYETQIEVL
ncbi:MAG: Wzz/FepE/Etk N-terminal domain-containing protein, partial [Cyanobacteria bacterium J06643_13]